MLWKHSCISRDIPWQKDAWRNQYVNGYDCFSTFRSRQYVVPYIYTCVYTLGPGYPRASVYIRMYRKVSFSSRRVWNNFCCQKLWQQKLIFSRSEGNTSLPDESHLHTWVSISTSCWNFPIFPSRRFFHVMEKEKYFFRFCESWLNSTIETHILVLVASKSVVKWARNLNFNNFSKNTFSWLRYEILGKSAYSLQYKFLEILHISSNTYI